MWCPGGIKAALLVPLDLGFHLNHLIVFSDQTVKFYFLVCHIKSQIIAGFPDITYKIIYESTVILVRFVCS